MTIAHIYAGTTEEIVTNDGREGEGITEEHARETTAAPGKAEGKEMSGEGAAALGPVEVRSTRSICRLPTCPTVFTAVSVLEL